MTKMNKKYLSLNFLQVVLIENLILLPTVKGFQLKIKNLKLEIFIIKTKTLMNQFSNL